MVVQTRPTAWGLGAAGLSDEVEQVDIGQETRGEGRPSEVLRLLQQVCRPVWRRGSQTFIT